MTGRVRWLNSFLGSLLAFLAPGAAVVGAALLVSSPGAQHVTSEEWLAAAVAAVVTSAAVRAQVAHQVHVDVPRAIAEVTPTLPHTSDTA